MIDTETKIKNAATDLLLKDGNFGLSMTDIAEKSEVSRTVINYYFRSKENLLLLLIGRSSVILQFQNTVFCLPKILCLVKQRNTFSNHNQVHIFILILMYILCLNMETIQFFRNTLNQLKIPTKDSFLKSRPVLTNENGIIFLSQLFIYIFEIFYIKL